MKTLLPFSLGILTCAILSLTFSKNDELELATETELSSLLFKNCSNVIRFGLPKDANIEYSGNHAKIIKGSANNEITVVPTSDSIVDLIINCNGKRYKQHYKSVKVPDPVVELRTMEGKLVDQKNGALSPGPSGVKIVVKPNPFFSSIHPIDCRYSAEGWLILLVRGKRPVAMIRVEQESDKDLSSIQQFAQPGDRILVEVTKINRENFMGKQEEVPIGPTLFNIPLN